MGSLKALPRPLTVFDEFGGAQEHAPRSLCSLGRSQQAEGASLQSTGSPAAQTWLTALARHCESAEGAKAKAELTELLHCGARSRSQVVAVQNRVRQQVATVFSWTHHVDDLPGTDNPQHARQCQYLFERVLHGVLLAALQQAAEEADGGKPLEPAERHKTMEQALEDVQLQLGLANASIEVVNFAYLRTSQEAFPWATLLLGRMHHTLELWQGCDWIGDYLEKPLEGAEGGVPGMPEDVGEYLSAIQVRVEEELAFIDNSALYKRIMATGTKWAKDSGNLEATLAESDGSEHGSPMARRRRPAKYSGRSDTDAALVGRFFSNMARTAMLRTHSICQEVLAEFPGLQLTCPELPGRVCVVVDLLLGDHLELLFGQHLSVCIACAIYYTVRLHGETLPFRKISGLMAEVLLQHDEATFGHVELPPLDGTGWDGSRDYGDTRAFYNRVFLPAFASYNTGELFGEEMAPTPAKQQLEAPDPAAARSDAAGSGGSGKQAVAQVEARAVATTGPKELRRLRRPLGQVSTNSSGVAACSAVLPSRVR